jgi:hypothetical protein
MSYYMGDYYAGDPGIGSFFAGLARSAVGAIPIVGPALAKIGSRPGVGTALARPGVQSIISRVAHPAAAAITAAARSTAGAVARHPVLSAAGAAGALAGTAAIAEHMGRAAIAGKGMHISKKSGRLVRNRRMNFCNPRALRRATRRLHSFARHYRKVVGFVAPRKPKGRMYFKARRRKAA